MSSNSPGATPDTAASAGRGGQTGRGGGRGGRGGRGNTYRNKGNTTRTRGFTGSNKDLEGHVFDLVTGSGQAILYEKTIDEFKIYIGSHFEDGSKVVQAIENDLTPVEFELPADLPKNASQAATKLFDERIKNIARGEERFSQNVSKLYSIVWGQCSPNMQTKLKGMKGYSAVNAKKDGLALLGIVRNVMQDYQDKKFGPLASYQQKVLFFNL
jgi:hypothetical protein